MPPYIPSPFDNSKASRLAKGKAIFVNDLFWGDRVTVKMEDLEAYAYPFAASDKLQSNEFFVRHESHSEYESGWTNDTKIEKDFLF